MGVILDRDFSRECAIIVALEDAQALRHSCLRTTHSPLKEDMPHVHALPHLP